MGLGVGGAPADDVLVGALALAVATATCAFASANHQRAYQRTAAYARQVALLAERDGLTGALNHRTFHERLRTEAARTTADRPLSLLLVDVDEFKTVNDSLGPPGRGRGAAPGRRDAGRPDPKRGRQRAPGRRRVRPPAAGHRPAGGDRDRRTVDGLRAHRRGSLRHHGERRGGDRHVGRCGRLQAAADAAVYRAKRSGRNRVYVPPAASDGPRSATLTPSGR
jgi:hypothetical protein